MPQTRIPRAHRYPSGAAPAGTSATLTPLWVRIVLALLAVPAVWLGICLLAVGGWLILPTAVVFIGATRRRRRRGRRR